MSYIIRFNYNVSLCFPETGQIQIVLKPKLDWNFFIDFFSPVHQEIYSSVPTVLELFTLLLVNYL